MKNNFEVVIVGGGASGLMCALTYALKGNPVCILEGGLKVGKKILVSGNGRCNLTNKTLNEHCYNTYPIQLKKFNNVQTLKLFESLGLQTYFDSEGRCYPTSNHSSAVLDVLLNKLNKLNVNIVTNCQVGNITKQDKFKISTSCGEFVANKVVIATGGNSMVEVLKGFNLNFKPFKPSLCGFVTKEKNQGLNGIRVNAKVTLKNNNFEEFELGEVQLKENGVSGICVFNLSAKLNWANLSGGKLSLDLMPSLSQADVLKMLEVRKQNLKTLLTKHFFDGLFVKNLGLEILNRSKINLQNSVESLTSKELLKLTTTIKEFNFNVIGFDSNNQVHHGGISLDDLTDNLESKTISNLFFCGEIVNVDGVCGGYNLQWAWSSGKVVGDNLWLKLII